VQGLRYFNVYGPLEDHKGDQASPITKFTKQARESGKISIFDGSDQYLRDFVYVGDVCEVHKQLLSSDISNLYNVGTGTAISFQEVAEIIAEKENASIEYIKMPENLQNQYQEYTCANIDRLNSVVKVKFHTVSDYVNGKI
jgi:ADP-L-glycero-D-manno-heptose 6-epimerase